MISANLSAQIEEKKTVKIKKVVQKDGETTTEVIEATGAEADKLLQEMRDKGTLENIDIEAPGEKKVRIVKKDMGEDLSKSMSSEQNLEVEKTVDDNGKITATYTLTEISNGKKKIIKWDGEGEPPSEMKPLLDAENHARKTNQDSEIEKCVVRKKKVFKSPNKAVLGVMTKDNGRGVSIIDVLDGSAAKIAGLKEGDTILKINEEYIFSMEGLLSSLSNYEPGQSVEVLYLRDKKEYKTRAILKALQSE